MRDEKTVSMMASFKTIHDVFEIEIKINKCASTNQQTSGLKISHLRDGRSSVEEEKYIIKKIGKVCC